MQTRLKTCLDFFQWAIFLLLISHITACQSPKQEWVGEQCSINTAENVCYCRDYKLSKEYIGKISGVKVRPLSYCESLIGYRPQEYAEYTTFLESVRLQIQNSKPGKTETTINSSGNKQQYNIGKNDSRYTQEARE